MGFPLQSKLGIFFYTSSVFDLQHLKWININFRQFVINDLGTQMLFMNHKCRSLEVYAVKWEYDMSNINEIELTKLNDGVLDEDDKYSKNNKNALIKENPNDKKRSCSIF
jgi:hypothetical protein